MRIDKRCVYVIFVRSRIRRKHVLAFYAHSSFKVPFVVVVRVLHTRACHDAFCPVFKDPVLYSLIDAVFRCMVNVDVAVCLPRLFLDDEMSAHLNPLTSRQNRKIAAFQNFTFVAVFQLELCPAMWTDKLSIVRCITEFARRHVMNRATL